VIVTLVVVAVFILAAAALGIYLLWTGLRDDIRLVDVAVVLGNHVFGDGTPSPRLAARLECAIDLYRRHLFQFVIVSGGISSSGVDEATTMAAYLRDAGLPTTAIVEDPLGINTAATARNTAAWMRANGAYRALVISQYFHIARIQLAFRQNGIMRTAHAHAAYWGWRDIYLLFREIAAFGRYAMRGR